MTNPNDDRHETTTRNDSGEADDPSDISLNVEYQRALAKLEQGDVMVAVAALERLHERMTRAAIFSENESLDDIATPHLCLLALEHDWAKALTQMPMTKSTEGGLPNLKDRLVHLQRACDLWLSWFQRLERLELVSQREQEEYHALVELSSSHEGDSAAQPALLSTSRDVKIARYNTKKQIQHDMAQLQALQERRKRLVVESEQEMDGHDQESLERSLALKTLELGRQEAVEEWSSVVQELPMLARMVQQQEHDRGQTERYSHQGSHPRTTPAAMNDPRLRPQPPPQPLKVTHITKDGATGQLRMQKEEIRSQVFRRGWNQPTMSLEELAEREVADAMERDARQKEHEAAQKDGPRRYEQLVKDGKEDDANLVDASAPLDRQWDDFKDENPKGSGNKRADVGDRNF